MRQVKYLLCALCAAIMLINAVAVMAEDHTVFIVSRDSRTISDIDPVTGKVIDQAQLESAPGDVVPSWDEQWLYVSEPDLGYIAILNAHTLKESSRLSKPEFKRTNAAQTIDELATTPDYSKLYVSVPGGLEEFDQRLLVYSPDYQQPELKIAITGQDGQRILVHGPTSKLYYAQRRDNQVVVLDTNTDKVLKTIPVKGGPMDVAFVTGGEAWVASADGTVSIIDVYKDEVIKTIDTGGKGVAHIVVAPDIRYLAVSHDDSGDVTILRPDTKEVVNKIAMGKGPLSVAFQPAGKGGPLRFGPGGVRAPFPPTGILYVTGPGGLSQINLDTMAVADHKDLAGDASRVLIHYSFPDAFVPPREGSENRIMENETYTLYNNAMFNYDVSPIHEHRTDMVAVIIGDGMAKLGCWKPECPAAALADGPGGLPYSNLPSRVGEFTGVSRGTLHIEEGVSQSPRRMLIFMPKNNYYRQMNPKKTSDFQGKEGFRLLTDNPHAWLWNVILVPGTPIHFPKTDYALVYLGGGLMRETRDNIPKIRHKMFAEWDTDPSERTIEALSNRIPMVVIEFK